VITAENVQAVFGLASVVIADPITGTPLVVPRPSRAPCGPSPAAD
jgi:iron complex transport system ATP-binding protein